MTFKKYEEAFEWGKYFLIDPKGTEKQGMIMRLGDVADVDGIFIRDLMRDRK